jgi:hypothetical protein
MFKNSKKANVKPMRKWLGFTSGRKPTGRKKIKLPARKKYFYVLYFICVTFTA